MKIKRTRIVIEVLSEVDQRPENMELYRIIEEGDTGSFSIRAWDEGSEILEGESANEACLIQGTDPTFFSEFQDED